jgi:hypothetical protein
MGVTISPRLAIKLIDKNNEGKKYLVALGGHQTTNKNTTTNQKHAGSTGERRDMRHNRRGAR